MSRNRPLSPILRDAFAEQKRLRAELGMMRLQAYIDAEAATNGALLNREGRRRRIDPMSLFTHNRYYANRYASDELLEWWQDHPRITYPDYEQQSYEPAPDGYYDREQICA
jgi:hypothetical protein